MRRSNKMTDIAYKLLKINVYWKVRNRTMVPEGKSMKEEILILEENVMKKMFMCVIKFPEK